MEATYARRRAEPISHAARLAWLLDSQFEIPGTGVRFGLDPLLGLVPGIGDTVSLVLSSLILVEARARGVRKRVLLRMVANIGIDWLIGLVPIAGDVFDLFVKANMKNLKLLEEELAA